MERVSGAELRLQTLEETKAEAAAREIQWQELNAQLRRYLGRLDAHAGRVRDKEANNQGPGLHPRADVIAAKFPRGLPSKE